MAKPGGINRKALFEPSYLLLTDHFSLLLGRIRGVRDVCDIRGDRANLPYRCLEKFKAIPSKAAHIFPSADLWRSHMRICSICCSPQIFFFILFICSFFSKGIFFGFGVTGGRSPVEHRRNLSVHPSVHPSISLPVHPSIQAPPPWPKALQRLAQAGTISGRMDRWIGGQAEMDVHMYVQILPVFYRNSSSFGAEALLTTKATINKGYR